VLDKKDDVVFERFRWVRTWRHLPPEELVCIFKCSRIQNTMCFPCYFLQESFSRKIVNSNASEIALSICSSSKSYICLVPNKIDHQFVHLFKESRGRKQKNDERQFSDYQLRTNLLSVLIGSRLCDFSISFSSVRSFVYICCAVMFPKCARRHFPYWAFQWNPKRCVFSLLIPQQNSYWLLDTQFCCRHGAIHHTSL
jgi:hypothetical protein